MQVVRQSNFLAIARYIQLFVVYLPILWLDFSLLQKQKDRRLELAAQNPPAPANEQERSQKSRASMIFGRFLSIQQRHLPLNWFPINQFSELITKNTVLVMTEGLHYFQ